MAHYWGDGSTWGDGDLYYSDVGVPFEYSVEREVRCHKLSVKVNYTASTTPGQAESFRIHSIRARASAVAQDPYGYEAFVDRSTPSERLAVVVKHSGSEFIISHIQLIAQRKRHQPKG